MTFILCFSSSRGWRLTNAGNLASLPPPQGCVSYKVSTSLQPSFCAQASAALMTLAASSLHRARGSETGLLHSCAPSDVFWAFPHWAYHRRDGSAREEGFGASFLKTCVSYFIFIPPLQSRHNIRPISLHLSSWHSSFGLYQCPDPLTSQLRLLGYKSQIFSGSFSFLFCHIPPLRQWTQNIYWGRESKQRISVSLLELRSR